MIPILGFEGIPTKDMHNNEKRYLKSKSPEANSLEYALETSRMGSIDANLEEPSTTSNL